MLTQRQNQKLQNFYFSSSLDQLVKQMVQDASQIFLLLSLSMFSVYGWRAPYHHRLGTFIPVALCSIEVEENREDMEEGNYESLIYYCPSGVGEAMVVCYLFPS